MYPKIIYIYYANKQHNPNINNRVNTIVAIQIDAATFALAVILIDFIINVFSYAQY